MSDPRGSLICEPCGTHREPGERAELRATQLRRGWLRCLRAVWSWHAPIPECCTQGAVSCASCAPLAERPALCWCARGLPERGQKERAAVVSTASRDDVYVRVMAYSVNQLASWQTSCQQKDTQEPLLF